jgi:PAS domain S-box-containing protein
LKTAISVSPTAPAATADEWLEHLALQARLLDGIEVGMCAFDENDCVLLWNQTFLRLFPEQNGRIARGDSYPVNLRRFYEARLDAAEVGDIQRYIDAGLARHREQAQPFEYEHHGLRMQASSLPTPGLGRIRVWRVLSTLPSAVDAPSGFAADLGSELLEYVPEALVVCGKDGRIVWANTSFCSLFGVERRDLVLGSTFAALHGAAWDRAPAQQPAEREKAESLVRDMLRFAGAPFELPLPGGRCCRVVARQARDGAVFYALVDISALKRYEAALQVTLDNAGRGIIRYDAKGRILLFNRQALQLLELPDGLLREGARITDLIRFQQQRGDFVPEDVPNGGEVAEKIGDVYSSGRYLRRTPGGRSLEISTTALPDGGAVRTYSDVTAYAQAQSALSEKTRALEITLDSMSQGISAIDSTGRLVFWNRRYQELLQLPESLLSAQPTMAEVVRFQTERGDFGPEFEYVDATARAYVRVGDKLAPLRGPETYVRKTADGRTFDVSTRPLPDGGVVRTFTDITASVHTQEALAHKQAQLGALVSNLPDRVWLKDVQGNYLLSNPAHLRYHQLDEADILGRTAIELFGSEKGGRHAESDARAMASDVPLAAEEYSFAPDGELHCAEVVKVPMRDESGACIGLLGIARDITSRKQEEVALIKAKEQALEASGAKSRFLSSMSHEIRTPMNAVLGMLTLLRGTPLSTRQEDYAGKAEGAARALLSLLNDILDFSKIEAGKMRLDPRPFSVEGMLSDLSVILSSNVGHKDIELLYDLDPRVPDGLVGDDMRLRQILINLGGNAVKFTEKGVVVVRTRLVKLEGEQASVEFTVQDTGMGITQEQQARLFGEFVQATDETARQFGGSGLGLGICRRLTDLMGADLQLASAPGVGSRFWFTVTLPLSNLDVPEDPPRTDFAQAPRVLIVDDNPMARDTLAALARAAGWHADTAQDGEQALFRVQSSAAMELGYDVVFVDWVMPGMDGWQTCARIRAMPLQERTPLVIMVTAHGREMLDQQPQKDQALLDGFLVKPVTAGMLRTAFRRALRGPGEAAPLVPAVLAQPLAGLRLLLAEDNAVNQQIAIELLARQGAQVDVAENGQLAIDRVATGPAYAAVLMDVQMPVMDGIAATRKLRERYGPTDLPIIAMTANAMDTDRQACLAAGMNDHVAKPFVIEHVVATILKCLGQQAGDAAPSPATQAQPEEALPVFDRAGALERMGGDEDLLATVLPVFRGNLEDAAEQLDFSDGLASEDLGRLVHSIKGMAANLGAMQLAALAGEVETQTRATPGADVGEQVRALSAAITQVLLAVQAGAETRH